MPDRGAQADKLQTAMAALAEQYGRTIRSGDLHYCVGYLLDAPVRDQNSVDEAGFQRIENFAAAIDAFISAREALSDDEADAFLADYDLIQTLRQVAANVRRWAVQKPPRKRGRKPKFHALEVAYRALIVFEIVTDRPGRITVDPTRESDTAGGAYHHLVATAFQVLSMKASPEHYARKAIRRRLAGC